MSGNKKVICIGAGPAGLTAAYILSKNNVDVTVLEKDPEYVGGISRTVFYKGFGFDIGGHRFFSKSREISELWQEILNEDFLERPRKSRIFYNGKFFDYPLKAFDALNKLGIRKSALSVASYAKSVAFPVKNPKTFEDWVSNKFGRYLFGIFFKTYTEKVWGMSCKEISADWAAQRIQGFSLAKAIKNALLPGKSSGAKTLINSFHYPRKGPGMMWETAAEKIRSQGGEVLLGKNVKQLSYNNGEWKIEFEDGELKAGHVISSMPIRELINKLEPKPSEAVIKAANNLKYRDFLIVGLIVKDKNVFDDNWIYIHDPSVKVGRIQNFKSWSEEMVPDQSLNCLGMEYFCFEHDSLWDMPDEKLKALAGEELVKLGLAKKEDILDGYVVRQEKAYPVYDEKYAEYVAIVRAEIESKYPGLHLVGRNGMHKYNNQDHAMMTAILTAKNIMAGSNLFNVWAVNQDAEYHEEIQERLVPRKVAS